MTVRDICFQNGYSMNNIILSYDEVYFCMCLASVSRANFLSFIFHLSSILLEPVTIPWGWVGKKETELDLAVLSYNILKTLST